MKCYSYIRFSSPEQAKGSSYERQYDIAKQYAVERGWILDENLSMFDAGLSGFHQEHTTRGSLGIFLTAVRDGKIETPSALLVENLDRLSRATIPQALKQFLDLIEAGITIVTLIDKQVYSPQSIEIGMQQLLVSISIMHRAHEESAVKQYRRSKAWSLCREKARNGKKFSATCPFWLKFSEKKQEYITIEHRTAIVRRIFDLYNEGVGLNRICKILNEEKVETFSSRKNTTNRWWVSYIRKILSNRAVLGEVQFMKTAKVVSGKRIFEPDGEPIENYYPKIIEKDVFLKAQNIKDDRHTPFGRIGEANNLFTKISKCGYCGATMYFSKRSRNKIPYLSCSNSMVKSCKIPFISFRYQDFEDAFLEQCNKLDIHSIISDGENELEKKINSIKLKILNIEDTINTSKLKASKYEVALTSVESTNEEIINFLTPKIADELINQKSLNLDLNRLKTRLAISESIISETSNSLLNTKTLISKINSQSADDRITTRIKLQLHIKSLVEKIEFFPAGSLENINNKYSKNERYAVAYFKGGGELVFKNNPGNDSLTSFFK